MAGTPAIAVCRLDREAGLVRRLAYLPNAYDIGYEQTLNGTDTCQFKIPLSDIKDNLLGATSLIELLDSGELVGLYRISTRKRTKSKDGIILEVTCRHVISTLMDKVMFSVHELSGHTIREVIEWILASRDGTQTQPKQTDWVLDRCDFDQTIDYLFENCTLYDALYAVPKDWTAEYQWVTDVSAYPWKLSLIQPSPDIAAEIRQGKNLVSVEIDEDFRQLRNRIYALGKGEGINQLTIRGAEDLEVEPPQRNGEFYVDDADSISRYGEIYEGIYADRSQERAPLLLQSAKKYLQEYSGEHPTYTVEAADIYRITHRETDRLAVGKMVRIIDHELHVDITGRVLAVSKDDLLGAPGDIRLTIGYPGYTLIDMLEQFRQNDHVTGTAAQGATNVWSRGFADNADADHPIKITFRLPDDLLYVNKCLLDLETEAFRAYEQGAASGGGTTIGMDTDTSSSEGGGQTISQSSTTSSSSGGATTTTSALNIQPLDYEDGTGFPESIWGVENEFNHYQDPPNRPLYLLVEGGDGEVMIPRHWHPEMSHSHDVSIGSHQHNIAHTHTLPMHTHKINHSHTLGTHTHNLEYGIFEEPTLAVSGLKVYVDGNLIGTQSLSKDGLDILQYLSTDSDGRINRGRHTIEIVPSPSGMSNALCRISGELFIQCFVQSRGDYAI